MYKWNETKLIEIFCSADDFCIEYQQLLTEKFIGEHQGKKVNEPGLSMSEIMSIEIFYHLSAHKCFKFYYTHYLEVHLKDYFPKMPSYNRFVQLKPRMAIFLFFYLYRCRIGEHTGCYYVDSAKLPACHNLRIYNHKVFRGIARRGKTSTGWFYGLKIHWIINEKGQLMAFTITPGNVADNNKELMLKLCGYIRGKIFGDKGYINQKAWEELLNNGLLFFTKRRRNMKNVLLKMEDKILLNKRGVIESAIELLKGLCNIDHTRHRSPINAIVNTFAGLAAYTHLDKLPHINMGEFQMRNFLPLAA